MEASLALCSRETWLLVVHNDFKEHQNFERLGNDIDIANLARSFCEQRNCKFAEIKNGNAKQILAVLSDQDALIQLFQQNAAHGECSRLFRLES